MAHVADELRNEYHARMLGVACWLTPTIIPKHTLDELSKGWFVVGTVTVDGVDMVIYAASKAVLMGNIHLGTWMGNKIKWGIAPQANARRSIGFDDPDWYDFIGFYMNGSTFKVGTKNIAGGTWTDVSFPANGATVKHTYEIEWFTDGVKFYIDAALVATHTTYLPRGPAGLYFHTWDSIAGNLTIEKGWELEQFRFPVAMT